MSELIKTLAGVKEKIRQPGSKSINEEQTKGALIQPVLRALGWDVENLEDVQLEYKRRPRDKPVDYALLLLRTPCLFVEAKALGQSLDDRRWASQLISYASVAGVEWVVLTNGDEYRIYNAHAPVPVEEKLFRSVSVTENETAAAKTLGLLSKECIRDNRIRILWNAHFVDRQVRGAVEKLFSVERNPNASLVRLIKKQVHSLPTKDIKASLRRVRIHFDFPEELARDLAELSTKRRQTREQEAGSASHGRKRVPVDVSLQDVIAEGLLRPPLKLSRRYKTRDLDATLHKDGTVEFQGTRYTSCSAAAAAARGSVIGGQPHTNGWTFWQFRGEDGQLVTLGQVRTGFQKARIVALERRA